MNHLIRLFAGNKIRAFILFAFSIAIFISLISYRPGDPSFNSISDRYPNNLLLHFGSYISDLLFQLAGTVAYVIPVFILVWSYELFYNGAIKWAKTRFLLMMLSISFMSALMVKFEISLLPAKGGGVLGILLWNLIRKIPYPLSSELYIYAYLAIFSKIFMLLALDVSTRIYGRIAYFFFCKLKVNISSNIFQKIRNIIDNYRSLNRATSNYQNNTSELIAPQIGSKEPLKNNKLVVDQIAAPILNAEKIQPNSPSSKGQISIEQDRDDRNLIPSIELLADNHSHSFAPQSSAELAQKSEELLAVLADFGVKGKIIDVRQGPVVTMYEFEPAAGTKSSRVIGLSDDIARSLSAISTRIAVIPGRNALGIELPNEQRMFFRLKELIQTKEFQDKSVMLPLILGKDLSGAPMVVDLAKMPHLLVAGTTGSGKSVAINAMIMSLLYRYTPEECRMIMIDPKMLELSAYDDIPHLMTPVVTEPGKAVVALKWAVKEMESRYRLMSHLGVRNIANYNSKLQEAIAMGQVLERKIQTGFDHETGQPSYEIVPIDMNKMPFIVVIVDEMADLMLVAGKDIETSIQRLAQMARAAGIHIIMATQRPSVDVITGVIKANFPSRISFKVTSKIDSRTILGEQGSEQLLGMGDMLYMGNSLRILRVHGPFVDDSEVEKVTNFLRTNSAPDYISAVTESAEDDMFSSVNETSEDDDIYKQAVNIVKTERKSSISYIQRCLRIGYNRAANIVEEMEKKGILSSPNSSGKREILIPED